MAELKVWFGVGSGAGPQSPVYSLFFNTKKADIYVAGRAIAHEIKASLHASGRWRFAHNGRPAQATPSSGETDRAFIKWERPPPFEPGLTRALQIVVAPSAVTTLNARLDKPDRVFWLPIPPKGSAVCFDVILSAPEWAASRSNAGEWPGKDEASSVLVFSHPLSSAETVWVVSYQRPIDEDDWLQRFEAEPQPSNIRTTLFAVHKTLGYGVYVEFPVLTIDTGNPS